MKDKMIERIQLAIKDATPQNMVRWAIRQGKEEPIFQPFARYLYYAARIRTPRIVITEESDYVHITDHAKHDMYILVPDWYDGVADTIGTKPYRDRLVAELHYQILRARS